MILIKYELNAQTKNWSRGLVAKFTEAGTFEEIHVKFIKRNIIFCVGLISNFAQILKKM
jgi:hypothetical protein